MSWDVHRLSQFGMQGEAAAPYAEATPAEGEEAKKEEPKEENPGDKDELWWVPYVSCSSQT